MQVRFPKDLPLQRFLPADPERDGGDQAEDSGDAEAALSKIHIAALEHVPGRNRQNKRGASAVTGGDGMEEFGLCPWAEEDVKEVRHLHSHGLVIKGGTDRVLHPAVGDQNPQSGEVGAQSHEECAEKVRSLLKARPAEEEKADEGGLQEEGHETFNRQRGAEDVAHVVRIV